LASKASGRLVTTAVARLQSWMVMIAAWQRFATLEEPVAVGDLASSSLKPASWDAVNCSIRARLVPIRDAQSLSTLPSVCLVRSRQCSGSVPADDRLTHAMSSVTIGRTPRAQRR